MHRRCSRHGSLLAVSEFSGSNATCDSCILQKRRARKKDGLACKTELYPSAGAGNYGNGSSPGIKRSSPGNNLMLVFCIVLVLLSLAFWLYSLAASLAAWWRGEV